MLTAPVRGSYGGWSQNTSCDTITGQHQTSQSPDASAHSSVPFGRYPKLADILWEF